MKWQRDRSEDGRYILIKARIHMGGGRSITEWRVAYSPTGRPPYSDMGIWNTKPEAKEAADKHASQR